MKTVCVSGHFDPLHEGHINLIKESKKLGDKLIVILNNEEQTIKKKGKCFQSVMTRFAILNELESVDMVVLAIDKDGSVCKTLEIIRPDVFANGGDRFYENVPEKKLCENLDIGMEFHVGGEKINSSSKILEDANLR